MAQFRFYQDKPVTQWVRDYYTIEAESLDEAIAIIEEADTSLDELSYEDERVEWEDRDTEYDASEWAFEDTRFPERFSIFACEDDEEILSR
jgi:hypothetical protein